MTLEHLLILFSLGAIASYLVGLIGASSGTIYIPALFLLLPLWNVHGNVVLIVMTTGICGITVNALVSSYFSLRRGQVNLKMLTRVWPWLALGGILGVFVIQYLSTQIEVVKILLGLLLLSDAIRISKHYEPSDDQPSLPVEQVNPLWYTGAATIASAFGLGSQAYMMFLLKKLHFPTREAIGTSRSMSLVSTLTSLVTFTMLALSSTRHGAQLFYWPAVIAFMVSAPIFIYLGFQHSYRLPIMYLKKYYAAFVALAGIWLIGYQLFGMR